MAREPVSSIGSQLPGTGQDGPTGAPANIPSPDGNGAHHLPPVAAPASAGSGGGAQEPPDPEDSEMDFLGLDRKNLGRIKSIQGCDSEGGRERDARDADAELVEDEQELNSERDSLGDDSYLAAIRRSGWYVYRKAVGLGSRLAWYLDGGLWMSLFIGLVSMWHDLYRKTGEVPSWIYLGYPGALVAGVLMASAVRGLGRHFAVTRLTILGHVHQTIDRLVRIAGKCVLAAGVLLLLLLGMMFFAPAEWSSWANQVSNLLSFSANILLGLAAGVGAHAAWILSLPTLRDTIDCELEMIRRTRRYIRRFIKKGTGGVATALALLLSLFLFAGDARAADSIWVWAIDVSDSMDPAQRVQGVNQMIEAAPERAHDVGATVIQVVKFSEEARLAEMAWVPVPPAPPAADCQSARPEMKVEKGLMQWSPRFAAGARANAVAACEKDLVALQQEAAAEQQAFAERLRAATQVESRDDVTTRLVPMLEDLVRNPRTVAIDMVTDGVDHSRKSPDQLAIPDHIAVTFVITRPNPSRRRPTLDDVLAAARAWDAVDGITVTTVSEYPGVWRALGGR